MSINIVVLTPCTSVLSTPRAEGSVPALFEFIKQNPLGLLITAISSPSYPYLQSSHIPWVLDGSSTSLDAPAKSRLHGHLPRQNTQVKATIEDASQSSTQVTKDLMIIFTGLPRHYVSSKFYTETKPSTGKVVPTWNYSAVQVYGKATIYFDPSSKTSAYLSQQIHDLSELCRDDVDLIGKMSMS
ncbi:hypothetical protein N7492_001976 [Penicillium capsulatum]|uniref:Transcriptional regulator n=1 Tax=Penicillium capsulatum TaxID=69766 RepID=A0A9W9LUT0_9EURO|nr:hypothetical protein N7492_001976 [Penicillium capsulatum]KAJ6123405.1 hypothetical protein N7512_005870 [Penicillium capsulatum]